MPEILNFQIKVIIEIQKFCKIGKTNKIFKFIVNLYIKLRAVLLVFNFFLIIKMKYLEEFSGLQKIS